MVYQWAEGFPNRGAKADVVGRQIERLRKANGGDVTEEVVVAAAEDAKSVLHPFFEWNDRKAAHEFRLNQGRTLIRSIKIVTTESPDTPIRAFWSVRRDADSPRVYTSIQVALADDDLRGQLIADAMRELESFKRKYGELREFADVVLAIENTVRLVQKKSA